VTAIWVVPWTTAYATRKLIFSAAMNPDVVTVKRISRDVVAIAARMVFGILILIILRDVKVKKQ
jgi:hypothetical protein